MKKKKETIKKGRVILPKHSDSLTLAEFLFVSNYFKELLKKTIWLKK